MPDQLALDLDLPRPGTPAALRTWLAEQRIPDCDCGYAWVHSPNEAYARTGRIPDGEYPRDYPRWVRTTVDERCPYHGSRRAGSTPDTGSTHDQPA